MFMKQLFSILALLSILGASCKKEEVNPKKDYSFLQITNATCINDYGVIVPCKVTNKGDIIEMYNAPVESNSIDTREQG